MVGEGGSAGGMPGYRIEGVSRNTQCILVAVRSSPANILF